MKITVFTDYRFACSATPTGVMKHAYFMARGLALNPQNVVDALVPSDQVGRLGALSFLPQRTFPLPWKVAMPLWTCSDGFPLDRWVRDSDWVYCPKNDCFPVGEGRVAMTVHGAHELDPAMPKATTLSERARRYRRRLQYERMTRRADLILSVSSFLKQQLVSWFGVEPEKVVVVGNGVDSAFYEVGAARLEQTPGSLLSHLGEDDNNPDEDEGEIPYVLCVGGLNDIDGGDRIVALANEIRRRGKKLRIKVAGCQHEPAMVQQAQATGCVDLLGYVEHSQLAHWMAQAVAFFFPTRYETFGMAAAEAMAAATIVITSRCTGVPEVVKDVGIYVDVDNAKQCLDAVEDVMRRPSTYMVRREQGAELSLDYTWDRCVQRLERAFVSHM